jgi:hypothetical protein
MISETLQNCRFRSSVSDGNVWTCAWRRVRVICRACLSAWACRILCQADLAVTARNSYSYGEPQSSSLSLGEQAGAQKLLKYLQAVDEPLYAAFRGHARPRPALWQGPGAHLGQDRSHRPGRSPISSTASTASCSTGTRPRPPTRTPPGDVVLAMPVQARSFSRRSAPRTRGRAASATSTAARTPMPAMATALAIAQPSH